ncbi:MAG: FCD domain-containing protein [Rhizobiales bacterium]|nr:FCD domain-containing protein [Hyphomicrobiales bacterium]
MRRVASAMPGVIENSVAQHCEVAEAVTAGDAEGVVAAYRRHLEHVRDTTIESWPRPGREGSSACQNALPSA